MAIRFVDKTPEDGVGPKATTTRPKALNRPSTPAAAPAVPAAVPEMPAPPATDRPTDTDAVFLSHPKPEPKARGTQGFTTSHGTAAGRARPGSFRRPVTDPSARQAGTEAARAQEGIRVTAERARRTTATTMALLREQSRCRPTPASRELRLDVVEAFEAGKRQIEAPQPFVDFRHGRQGMGFVIGLSALARQTQGVIADVRPS